MSDSNWEGKQTDAHIGINVLRLSELLPWKVRLDKVKKFADDFNPDWISLQFVPFGYQIKGLPFGLEKRLKYVSHKVRWHIMFHELSVNKDESLKFRLWAFLQVQIIRSLLKGLKPSLITTNTEVYQHSLQKLGYPSIVLPLFSNIQRADHPIDSANDKIPDYLQHDRSSFITGTLFGAFSFKSWNLHSLLDKLVKQYQHKKIIIAAIGKMSSGSEYWKMIKAGYPSIQFLEIGMQDVAFISYWLTNYTDFGILTTLPELSGKSGSFMAFKEHGIPVLCKEPDGRLKKYNITLDTCLTVVTDDDTPLSIPPKFAPASLLEQTSQQFITLLNQ